MRMKSTAIRLPYFTFSLLMALISLDSSAESLRNAGSYEKCVLESTKGITSERINGILRDCREEFADSGLTNVELPPDALGKLIVHAGFGWGIFSGSIYNGNSDYIITQLTVLIAPTGNRKSAAVSTKGSEYNIDLTVQPLTKGALSMPVPSDNTLEYSWKVATAHGYRIR